VRAAALLTMLALVSVEGCASLMPATPNSAPASGSAISAAPQASGGGASAASGAPRAVVDSLPSADAQRVLDSIPEPIPAAERVPPPAPDSLHTTTAADTTRAVVPVPEPTAPLGEKPGSAELAAAAGGVAAADSAGARGAGAAASAPASGSAAPGGAASPAGSASAGSAAATGAVASGSSAAGGSNAAGAAAPRPGTPGGGPCYRLQVAAPKERAEAESMKRAAESQLELPFTITQVKSLYKVRTRDCLGEDAVQHLRARARASGFSGAFTVVEGAK